MSDLLVNLTIFVMALLGGWLLWKGINNLRVLLSSRWWPGVTAKVREAKVVTKVSRHLLSEPVVQPSLTSYSSIENSVFGTLATRTDYTPLIAYDYFWQGVEYKGSNRSDWNHHGMYGEIGSKAWVEKAAREPLQIRVNPQKPAENFIGVRHYPFILTLIISLAGWALFTGGTAIVIDEVLALFAQAPIPTWQGRSVLIYALSALPLLYFVWTCCRSLYTCMRHPDFEP